VVAGGAVPAGCAAGAAAAGCAAGSGVREQLDVAIAIATATAVPPVRVAIFRNRMLFMAQL